MIPMNLSITSHNIRVAHPLYGFLTTAFDGSCVLDRTLSRRRVLDFVLSVLLLSTGKGDGGGGFLCSRSIEFLSPTQRKNPHNSCNFAWTDRIV